MTKKRTTTIGAAAVLGLLSALLAMADIRVCNLCGHENDDAAVACGNCGGELPPLPRTSATGGSQSASDIRPAEFFLDGTRVEEELVLADKYLAEGAPEVARLYAMNALAMDLLTDRTQDPSRTARIADLVKTSRGAGMVVARTCPDCGGTGKEFATMPGLSGSTMPRAVHGRNCGTCSGRGVTDKPATVSEQKQNRGNALKTYTTLQQGRQYASVGTAWIPADMRDRMSTRQTAALLTASASPCQGCLGFGREDCADCRGVGTVPCPQRGCVKGWVEETQKGQLVKGTTKRTVRCRVCEGRGFVTCVKCRGSGSLLCERCQGLGERPICVRCSGQGYDACRRCRGSGEYRGALCQECGGEGVSLCRTCSGDGRKR